MLAHGVVVQQVMVGKAQLQEHEEAAPIVRGPRGMMLAPADFLLFRFCACVPVCVWVSCTSVCIHAHVHRGQRRLSGALLYLLHYSFETGPFTNSGTKLAASKLQSSSCPLPGPTALWVQVPVATFGASHAAGCW